MVQHFLKGKLLQLVAGAVGIGYCINQRDKITEASTFPPLNEKWDYNWDRRGISSVLRQPRPQKEDESTLQQKISKLSSTATRHILLVRHGEYLNKTGSLTLLGHEQAKKVGRRLVDLNFPYTRLVYSTMTRATETAREILTNMSLPSDSITGCDLLREGDPVPTEPPVGGWKEEFRYYRDGSRIEAAFRTYFHRAPPEQKEDSYEIIVCHANVIRYFVCRLLQFPPEAWLRFRLYHCSITWATIYPNGHAQVLAVGDAGFLPPDQLTTRYAV